MSTGARIDKATFQKMLASGMTVAGGLDTPKEKESKAKVLVELKYIKPGEWYLPIKTASEINNTDWRGRSARTKNARDVVMRVLGRNLRDFADFAEHYHNGGIIQISLVRLGCRHLDITNLPSSLKATEDAFAGVMGANDGDRLRWRVSHNEQTDYPSIGVYCKIERL